MNVALLRVEIHLGQARSLKEKRMVINRLKDRLRARFNLSLAEVEHQDLWQRATLAMVAVASDRGVLDRTLAGALAAIERDLPGEVIGAETEQLI